MPTAKAAKLVMDASAVVRILEGSAQAAAMHKALLAAYLVLAPELMLTEEANALWRLQRAGQLELDGLQRRLIKAAELVDHIDPTAPCKQKPWPWPPISIIRWSTACIWRWLGERWPHC
jgi:hypothetical protein